MPPEPAQPSGFCNTGWCAAPGLGGGDVWSWSLGMKTNLAVLFMGLMAGGPALAADVAPAADQIASALLAAPKERRTDATVLGYNDKGEVVTLRKGSGDLICLADDPADKTFSVACYHKDLEPFMARGRELAKQGTKGKDRHEMRWKEVEQGKVPIPREPRLL